MSVRPLTEADVTFSIECEPEDVPIEGNCSAIDEKTDRRVANWIRKQLDRGNEWAWCHVIVRARWNGIEGSDALGCCSFRSQEEFTQPDGYYPQMKKEALADLNRNVEALETKLSTIREN
jgi:hypothetical protein